ncbi:unnamed protein product, partial [Didymodactylos carnosus]
CAFKKRSSPVRFTKTIMIGKG